jgi:hypothetical protein
MRLVGNILDITKNREDKNKDVEVHLDMVEYITYKKDGHYSQPFDFVDDLATPLIITGDQLSRANPIRSNEGEHEFKVYDRADDGTYELNENKILKLTTVYDFDLDLTILSAAEYTIIVSGEEFKEIKRDRATNNKQKGRR